MSLVLIKKKANMSRRILFLTSHIPYPPKSGDKIVILNTIRGLLDIGYDVHVLSLYSDNTELKNKAELEFMFGIEVTAVKAPSKFLSVLRSFFNNSSAVFLRFFSNVFLRILIDKIDQFDYVYAHHTYMAQYFTHLSSAAHHSGMTKLLCDVHVLQQNVFNAMIQNEHGKLRRILLKHETNKIAVYEKKSLSACDFVFSYGEYELLQLKNAMSISNAHFRPVPIDMDFFKNSHDHKVEHDLDCSVSNINDIFSFFGDYGWYPNLDGLFFILNSVWPGIHKAIPSAKLYVAGRNATKELVDLCKNTPGVVFFGEVDDINVFLEPVSFVLSPIRIGGGIRLKVIEGMACSKVVIVNQCSSEGVIDKSHMLFLESAEFISSLKRLVFNTCEYRDFISSSTSYVFSNYSISSSTKRLEAIICE